MPKSPSPHAAALAKAAVLLGGVAQLSSYLGVSRDRLMCWIRGQEAPSAEAFLDVVDLLMEHDLLRYGGSPARFDPKEQDTNDC